MKRRVHPEASRLLALSCLSLTCSSCIQEVPTSPDALDRPAAAILASSQQRHLNYNERMALLADRLPGYAGHFLNEQQQLVVRLVDTYPSEDEVRRAVADFLEAGVWGPEARRNAARAVTSALVVASAQYDFRQLFDWFYLVLPTVRRLDGYKVADIDEVLNRIEIRVYDSASITAVEEVLAESSIPREAVVISVSPGLIVPLSEDLNSKVRPLLGGLQIEASNNSPCTMAFNAKRTTDGTYHMLTAAHCIETQGSVGEDMYQPTDAAGNYVGYESYDNQVYACGGLPPNLEYCIDGDVAAARYDGASWLFGQVAFPSYHSTTYSATRYIVSAGDVMQGDTVVTLGMVTGTDVGFITDTCAYPDYPDDPDLMCAFEVDVGEANFGDSGGPVIDELSSPEYSAAGIISGGDLDDDTIWFTPWSSIVAELSGDWCVDIDCAPDPHVSIVSGPSEIPAPPPDIECEWSALGSGGVPPYSYAWSGAATGTGSILSTDDVTQSGWLYITITDYADHEDVASIFVTVDGEAELPEECEEFWQ